MQLRGSKQAARPEVPSSRRWPWPRAFVKLNVKLVGPGGQQASSSPAAPHRSAAAVSGTINAAGSSFQNTFQQARSPAFKSVNSGVTVNYDSVGSGTGRSDLYSNTVLFAGSDSPIPASEPSKVPAGKTVLYFPVVIGPITLSYNLSGVSNLKLDPTVIANIFQGKIKTWNDPAIKAINPGVSLPSTAITIAVRSDSSGTTQNFTLFLQDAAPSAWKLGSASTIKWPSTAHAGAQNGGVASIVKSTPGAIGYVDYTHRQGLRPDRRVGAEQGRRLRRTVTGRRLRGRGGRHDQGGPYVRRGRGEQRAPTPTRSPTSPGTWCTRSSPTPTTRRCSRPTSATCSTAGQQLLPSLYLRAAAVRPRPEGRGAAEPDHLLLRMTFMTQASESLTGLFS